MPASSPRASGPADGCPPNPHRHDPLRDQRGPDDPPFDVFLAGDTFLDIVLTDLDDAPAPGREVWAHGLGSCPGGIANLAVAAVRTGLRTALATVFGDDAYGEFCRTTLADQEHIDLSCSTTAHGQHSSVTVSMAYDSDRAMVTHAHATPDPLASGANVPRSRATIVSLTGQTPAWVTAARAAGTQVVGSVGWDGAGVDGTGGWDPAVLAQLDTCDVFVPNHVEAMAYTRTEDAASAASALADRVPVVVITLGPAGSLAIDQRTGEEARVPSVPVTALDATGAGDVFCANFVLGTLAGWPLTHRLAFANLAASLSVQHFGGSLAAPGWGDIADWHEALHAAAATGRANPALLERYAFLADVLPADHECTVRRARATLGLRADV